MEVELAAAWALDGSMGAKKQAFTANPQLPRCDRPSLACISTEAHARTSEMMAVSLSHRIKGRQFSSNTALHMLGPFPHGTNQDLL